MAEHGDAGLRSALGRVTGLGSAKDGTGHWWAQRLTAVALVPLALWFMVSALALPDFGFATVHAWLARPLDAFLAALTIATLAYHSHLGTTVVVEDYVHAPGTKLVALVALRFAHVLAGGAGIFALLRLTIGTMGS